MSLYMVQCDFQPESTAWAETAKILNSYEGKRHRLDSWFIMSEEPVSILFEKFKETLSESDYLLITKISEDHKNNYPPSLHNWIDSKTNIDV